ncbi:hypothetical protein HDU96_001986 [Phlyctochytrium bullatum]|nr:hypothetical protein HDU96_001986 [Phlyctochytrium bullatum]
MPLETLPIDVLLNIIRRLHPSSLHLLAAVCRRLRRNLDASVLTFSFAKSHIKNFSSARNRFSSTRRIRFSSARNRNHLGFLQGSRFDLPFLKNYALAAGAVFGFSNGLLEMMWGHRWLDTLRLQADMVVSAFRKGIWQIQFPTPLQWCDRQSLEYVLNIAVHLRSLELVDILRKANFKNTPADFNNKMMLPFLELCIKQGFLEGIDLIPNHHRVLSVDSKPNSLTSSPLLIAAVTSLNPAVISLLLSKGCPLTPLALYRAVGLCQHRFRRRCNAQAMEVVRLLLDSGADPNANASRSRDSHVFTALHAAVMSGCPNAVRLCLDGGADPNCIALAVPFMRTPLYIACRMFHFNITKILLDHGADITDRGPTQCTVLHAVADARTRYPPPIVRRLIALLVDRGAPLENRLDKWPNHTALELACKNGNVEVAVELLRAGADPAALKWFSEHWPEEREDKEMLRAVAMLARAGDSVAEMADVAFGDLVVERARRALEQGMEEVTDDYR